MKKGSQPIFLLTGLVLIVLLGGCDTTRSGGYRSSRSVDYDEDYDDVANLSYDPPKVRVPTTQEQKSMAYIKSEVLKYVGKFSKAIPENFVGPIKNGPRTVYLQRGYFANSLESSGWVISYSRHSPPAVEGDQLVAYYIDNKAATDFIKGTSKVYPKNIIFSVATVKPQAQEYLKNKYAKDKKVACATDNAKMIILERGTQASIYGVDVAGKGITTKSLCKLRNGVPPGQLFLHMDDMKKSIQDSYRATRSEINDLLLLEKDLMNTFFKQAK